MKAPVPNRLLLEDYQDAPPWFGRVLAVLNRFQEQTIAVLDGGISLGENIYARKFGTNFTTVPTYGTGTFAPISFSWNSAALPNLVLLTSVELANGTPFLGNVGTVQWNYNSGNIIISYIPGLAINTQYTFTFLAI